MMQVKNRAPAAIQVTAEQLIRTAREFQVDDEKKVAKLKVETKVQDTEELRLHQAEKRREFEDKLRHTAVTARHYLRYAKWEETQMEFRRMRSIMERCLEVHHRDYTVWVAYADMEARNKFVNHARNVLDRAVQHLPRMNALWYRFVQLEQALGEMGKARLIFERWMAWEPEKEAWFAYVNFLTRNGDIKGAREVFERFCGTYPVASSYIKRAKFEEGQKQLALARNVFERALEELDSKEARKQSLFIAFAKFEERCKEIDRARAIYKHALQILPKEESRDLYQSFVAFERIHGDRESIETILLEKRRTQLEDELKRTPENYDLWYDLVNLEMSQASANAMAARQYLEAVTAETGSSSMASRQLFQDKQYAEKVVTESRERVRSAFDRAVSHVPPSKSNKELWRRYIYLWINYVLFEEMETEDFERCRELFRKCLNVIPHKKFTFGKIWIMAAHFELRRKDLTRCRKIFGEAIGRCPKNKVFKAYIQMELQLGNVDRCRKLYEKYLEFNPQNCFIWGKFAQLESSVGETSRARAIFELGVNQPVLDAPETLWKKYIDFEIGLNSKTGNGNAKKLYLRLLEKTQHVKVYMSFAKFEAFHNKAPEDARKIFEKVYNLTKQKQVGDHDLETKEERALILRTWLETEEKLLKTIVGETPDQIKQVELIKGKQPRKVKKRREVESGGFEEYFDYLFPDDPKRGLALLQASKQWKRKQQQSSSSSSSLKKQKADDNEIDLDDI